MVRAGLILIWTFLKAYGILSPFALQPQYYYVFRYYVFRYRQKHVFYVTLTVLITLPLTPTVKIFKEAKVIMCHLAAAFGFKSLVNKHVILKYPPVLSLAALKFYCIPAHQPMRSLEYDFLLQMIIVAVPFVFSNMEYVNTVSLCLRLQYCQSCQSMDFPSLLCLHMPSAASAHAQ